MTFTNTIRVSTYQVSATHTFFVVHDASTIQNLRQGRIFEVIAGHDDIYTYPNVRGIADILAAAKAYAAATYVAN